MAKRNTQMVDYQALRDRFAEIRDKVEELEASFEDRVTERPVQSVMVAAGIGAAAGLLAAALMRRK